MEGSIIQQLLHGPGFIIAFPYRCSKERSSDVGNDSLTSNEIQIQIQPLLDQVGMSKARISLEIYSNDKQKK